MHTTVHAPRTKDHALIFGPKNQREIIATIQTEWHMLKPSCACAVAESILTRPRTKKAWSPKIGGNDLELAWWSSHLPVRNGMPAVCILEPRPQCLWSCAGGDSIPTKLSRLHTTVELGDLCHGKLIISLPRRLDDFSKIASLKKYQL